MSNIYPVNEVFETIQGEATYTGTPSVFIRLQGCPVGCSFCDTKHTWTLDEQRLIPVVSMLNKVIDEDTFSYMHTADIMLMLEKYTAKHIVITGGEPCLYDLTGLTTTLLRYGYTVQIETSGTYEIRCHPDTFITLSPKINMAGGLDVIRGNYVVANEIKFPVGKQGDIDKLKREVIPYAGEKPSIWLQPLSQSNKATALCIQEATYYNWRISIQTHKFLGVR